MHQFQSKECATIYQTSARDITVVKGNSGVLYPLYRSSGMNSSFSNTWFPWMGYFDRHPEANLELYMVKPPLPPQFSHETERIIYKFLSLKAPVFMARMANEEALAISCSLGEGIWKTIPDFKKEIMQHPETKKYLKNFEEQQTILVETPPPTRRLAHFTGVNYSGIVKGSHEKIAHEMEKIIKEECSKYISFFSIQDRKEFPTQKTMENSSSEKQNGTSYLVKHGFLSEKPSPVKNSAEMQDKTQGLSS